VNLLVDVLTANGVMEPGWLFESPDTDYAPTGPDGVFAEADVRVIVDTFHEIKQHAVPTEVA
jgi:type I restriction enzyme R subunit